MSGNFNTLEEHGYTSRFSDLKLFLHNEENKSDKKYIHMQVNSRHSLPEELKETRIQDLPPTYQDPIYICPNTIQLNVYKSETDLQPPIDYDKIVDNCTNIERIYLNMYPGGSACEVNLFRLTNIFRFIPKIF